MTAGSDIGELHRLTAEHADEDTVDDHLGTVHVGRDEECAGIADARVELRYRVLHRIGDGADVPGHLAEDPSGEIPRSDLDAVEVEDPSLSAPRHRPGDELVYAQLHSDAPEAGGRGHALRASGFALAELRLELLLADDGDAAAGGDGADGELGEGIRRLGIHTRGGEDDHGYTTRARTALRRRTLERFPGVFVGCVAPLFGDVSSGIVLCPRDTGRSEDGCRAGEAEHPGPAEKYREAPRFDPFGALGSHGEPAYDGPAHRARSRRARAGPVASC